MALKVLHWFQEKVRTYQLARAKEIKLLCTGSLVILWRIAFCKYDLSRHFELNFFLTHS